jgi:CRP-like cAMP-binding protein
MIGRTGTRQTNQEAFSGARVAYSSRCPLRVGPRGPRAKAPARGGGSDVAPGRVLTREGEPVAHLVYLAEGMCRIKLDGATVAILDPGVLVGEMTYHTGQPATATVVVDAPARILAFERDALDAFLQRNDDIRVALEQSVAGDLRRKLADTTRTLALDRRRAGVTP